MSRGRDYEDFKLGEVYDRRLKLADKAREAYGNVPADSPRYREAQQRLAAVMALAPGVLPRSGLLKTALAQALLQNPNQAQLVRAQVDRPYALIESLTGGTVSEASRWGGWLTFAYAIMQFLFAPVLGNLSDRFGRRPVLLCNNWGAALCCRATRLECIVLAWFQALVEAWMAGSGV